MPETRFTKGPWKHFPNGYISDAHDNIITEMFPTNTAPWKEDADLIASAPDLYAALDAAQAYGQIRQTGILSDEYHALIKPWIEQIESEVGEFYPPSERFPGWHRDGMCSLANRRRDAALAKAKGEVKNV